MCAQSNCAVSCLFFALGVFSQTDYLMEFFFFYFTTKTAPCKQDLPGSGSWRHLGDRLALKVSVPSKNVHYPVGQSCTAEHWAEWVGARALPGSAGNWRT